MSDRGWEFNEHEVGAWAHRLDLHDLRRELAASQADKRVANVLLREIERRGVDR